MYIVDVGLPDTRSLPSLILKLILFSTVCEMDVGRSLSQNICDTLSFTKLTFMFSVCKYSNWAEYQKRGFSSSVKVYNVPVLFIR